MLSAPGLTIYFSGTAVGLEALFFLLQSQKPTPSPRSTTPAPIPTPRPIGSALLLLLLLEELFEDIVSAAAVFVCVPVEPVVEVVPVVASLIVDVFSSTIEASVGIVVTIFTGSRVKTCVELLQSQPP